MSRARCILVHVAPLVALLACGGSTGGVDGPEGSGGSAASGAGHAGSTQAGHAGAEAGTAGQGGAGQAGSSGGTAGQGGAGQAGSSAGTAGGGQAGASAGSAGAGQAGASGAGQAGSSAGTAGTSGGGTSASAGTAGGGQAGAGPTPEICDGVDNDQDGTIDDGCDDDKDGYCDATMGVTAGALCAHGGGDCDDTNPKIYPGSTDFQEGVDSNCDGKKEYLATLVVTVDDAATEICANGKDFTLGPAASTWTKTDSYSFVMTSGPNAVGISGKDTGMVITAMAAYLEVAGQKFPTRGVPGGKTYVETDPEWTETPWRYYPKLISSDKSDWCSAFFDDATWGPAMRAGYNGVSRVGDASPWGCGTDLCAAFPDGADRPDWIWDPYPVDLQSAWIRIKITLP